MITLALAAVPNQTFTATLDENRYVFNVYSCGDVMCCDISVNEVQIITGQRILGGEFLIPFAAYEGLNGNFLLMTNNYELPTWSEFGATQTLIYLSFDEIKAAVQNE